MPVSTPWSAERDARGQPTDVRHVTVLASAGSTSVVSCCENGIATGTVTVLTEARGQLATRVHIDEAAWATAAAPAPPAYDLWYRDRGARRVAAQVADRRRPSSRR